MLGATSADGGAPSSLTPVPMHGGVAAEIPDASPALDAIYAAVPRHSDEGYESDTDTMPSLQTVSDSSDYSFHNGFDYDDDE